MNASQVITSLLLGLSLSVDADSVSVCYGLKEKDMKINKMLLIAFYFGFMQGVMPCIGYFITFGLKQINISGFDLANILSEYIIPIVGFLILSFIGLNMLYESESDIKEQLEFKNKDCDCKEVRTNKVSLSTIILGGIATSIDALTVGFSFGNETIFVSLITFLIVMIITFILSFASFFIGRKFGKLFDSYASKIGGFILILLAIKLILCL